MQQFLGQLKKIAARYSRGQKITALVVVVVLVAGLFGLVTVLGKTRYQVLYSGLNDKDAGSVTKKLDELKVPYKIQGSAIFVPAGEVDETRIELAGAGLPAGSKVGFEIFDNASFGASDFNQQVNYQRAMEGELARSICSMDQVEDAVVHIAMSEDNTFSSEEQAATASVLLTLNGGAKLDGGQVAAVSNLVACAVPGLKPESVSVVDAAGNVLTGNEGSSAVTSEHLSALHAYESAVQAPLQSILDRVVGKGKGVVKVSMDLDFSSKTSQVETFKPAGTTGAPQEQKVSQESYGAGATPGATTGTPGTTSNIPGYTTGTTATAAGGNAYVKSDAETTFNNDHTIEEIKSPPGTIKRMSIAVLVDRGVNQASTLSMREAISAAAGLDTTRGDVISVQSVAFDTSQKKAAEKQAKSAAFWKNITGYAKTAGLVLLAGLALFLVWRKLRKARKGMSSLPTLGAPGLVTSAGELPGGGPEAIAAGASAGGDRARSQEELLQKARPLLEGVSKPAVLEAIEMLAKQKPEEVAQMLKVTMKEQR